MLLGGRENENSEVLSLEEKMHGNFHWNRMTGSHSSYHLACYIFTGLFILCFQPEC